MLGSMPGGPAFTLGQSRTPLQNTRPVKNRWLYRAGRYSAQHTGSYAGPAGFYVGHQPNTLLEHDSGKGPVAVPDRPVQSPALPATNASTGKKLFQRGPFFRQTLGEVFGKYGW
jgi:hypothetical protein